MKKIALTALFTLASTGAFASSHREAPSIANDPVADNTDVYAWVKPGTHDKLYVIANYVPLEEPAGGPNFHQLSDDVRYEIHITKGDSLDDFATYRIELDSTNLQRVDVANQNLGVGGGKEFFIQLSGRNQTYRVKKMIDDENGVVLGQGLAPAPLNIGSRSTAVGFGAAAYDDAFAGQFVRYLSDGTNVFVGPRDDAFYVDLGGVFDLANLRGKGDAQDGVAGFNTHTIALEIPMTALFPNGVPTVSSNNSTLGVWASASRRKVTVLKNNGERELSGPFVQVSRLGLPLINEVVIGLQDKDKFNATKPKNDLANFGAYFLNPVIVRDAEAVGIYAALGVNSTPFKFNRTDIVGIISLADGSHNFSKIGDVLRVDVAKDSQFPNGRSLQGGAQPNQEQVDVTDTLMTVILAGGALPLGDGVDYNDKPLLTQFPFLPLPWEGRTQGHGKPTP